MYPLEIQVIISCLKIIVKAAPSFPVPIIEKAENMIKCLFSAFVVL